MPPRKRPEARAGRHQPRSPDRTVEGREVAAPELPERYRGNTDVESWWTTWVESPQATQFESTDWLSLIEALPLVEALFAGELKWAAEVRIRTARLGATLADRAKAGIVVRRPEPKRVLSAVPTSVMTPEEIRATQELIAHRIG